MTNYITSAGTKQYTITIASGSTTGTVTINAVSSLAFILHGGLNPSVSNNPAEDYARVTLTNSTTITATRNTGTTGTVIIQGSIIDATSNLIADIQYGTATISASSSSGTATISAVTDANSAIHLLGWSSTNTSFGGTNEMPVLTQSGTTVTASRQGTTGALVVGFVVISFNGSVLNKSIQRVAATSASLTGTTYTAAVTSVVTTNAFCIYAGSNLSANAANMNEIKQYGQLTSSTLFTVTVNSSSNDAAKYNCSLVEFISGLLASSVQRGTTTLTAVSSNTTTITSSPTTTSALSFLGNITSTTTANLLTAEGKVALTNATTVTTVRNTSTSNLASSWEVINFPAFVVSGDPIWFGMTF